MEEYLQPLEVTQHRLAVAIGVPPRRISTDTALRLARYFGTSERFWLNLQDRYDIEVERDRSDRLSRRYSRSSTPELGSGAVADMHPRCANRGA